MRDFDHRRNPYFPMDVLVAFGKLGTKLNEKWQMEGLCTWLLFLATCKREPNQGTFTYTTDEDGWGKLGAVPVNPDLTLDAFFTFTGRMKKTSRRRHGRIMYVSIRPELWEKWTRGAAQKPRKPGENIATLHEISKAQEEVEVEIEVETRPLSSLQVKRLIDEQLRRRG